MTSRRAALPVVLAVLVALVGGGVWLGLRSSGSSEPQAAARTSFPDLTPATGAPTLPSLTGLTPAPGAAVEAAGPFDDRFHWEQLAFDGRAVRGSVVITSDVSALLELEAVAGFYDRDGTLLGTARAVEHAGVDHDHADEGPPEQTHPVSIAVPDSLRGRAVSAAVGIPVLVNE